MRLFKEKVSYDNFIIIVYQLGLSIFNSSEKFFEDNKVSIKEPILFVVLETSISTLFNKQLNNNYDIVDDVNKIVCEAFNQNDAATMIQYYVYAKEEIYDLINNHIYIKDLVDYILNEITNTEQHTVDENIVAFLCDVFGNLNDEIKNIVSSIKIIK